MGRSRGGLTTKIHALTDARGLPINFVLTPGQTADVTIFFANASGDIDLQIFQSCGGGGALQTSQSTTDNESVSVTNNTGGNVT